ncbi:exostosin-like 3 [Branchiostoma floridae x Branchiostoma belcheri]
MPLSLDLLAAPVLRCLHHIRLSRIIAMLLVILIVIPLITHWYLGSVDGTSQRHDLPGLDTPGIFQDMDPKELRHHVHELHRIKSSVSNELLELESKRQRLQGSISHYNGEVEQAKVELETARNELNALKLQLRQTQKELEETMEAHRPRVAQPHRILPSENDNVLIAPPAASSSCRQHTCFDYSRCSLTSGFPVYVYPTEDSIFPLDSYIQDVTLSSLEQNLYLSSNPATACVYVVIVGTLASRLEAKDMERKLTSLPYWRGDGRNHLLINLARDYSAENLLRNIETGRAMVVQSEFMFSQYRAGFDIVIPPVFTWESGRGAFDSIPPQVPAHRKHLFSFVGEKDSPGVVVSEKGELFYKDDASLNRNDATGEVDVLADLVAIENNDEDNLLVKVTCGGETVQGLRGEWQLCGKPQERQQVLRESTFSIIIVAASSVLSSVLTTVRLYESLKYGAVPVILGEQVQLPFSEVIDWQQAAFVFPLARVSELHFFLRTVSDSDLLRMRLQGRFLWETYLSSPQAVLNTVLSVVRTRISIPPKTVPEEPSPTVYNEDTYPLLLEEVEPISETGMEFGPVEPPYDSPKFLRNFTTSVVDKHTLWNTFPGPFYLYPYLPTDPVLPSEAKFMGSGLGFRPINKGSGGAGKEFQESLGGNVPREQFTIVMLTYERESVLINSLQRLIGLPYLNKVLVVWNSPNLPSEDLRWPDIGVPIVVIRTKKNSLNNRFLPYDVIETEAILSIDDDAHLRHDEILFGFRVWREARDRVVGFPGRFHAWDGSHQSWLYNSNYSCELSMVLTGAAFFHKYYAYLYSYVMPQVIRDKVDEYLNCEDIAMNFLVSHITRKPPIKVTSRWTFRCPGCPQALSHDDSHFQERHKCINFFVQVYGYMPLLNTQFRVDSVLFKTRLPHDKQKCFKFI